MLCPCLLVHAVPLILRSILVLRTGPRTAAAKESLAACGRMRPAADADAARNKATQAAPCASGRQASAVTRHPDCRHADSDECCIGRVLDE